MFNNILKNKCAEVTLLEKLEYVLEFIKYQAKNYKRHKSSDFDCSFILFNMV